MNIYWMQPLVSYYKQFFGDKANIVFDIGTRDGDDAFFLQKELNADLVYAIDARKDAVEKTKIKYPDFYVYQTAISDFNGTTTFYEILSDKEDYVGSSSIFSYKFKQLEYQPYNVIEVPTTTMDDFIQNNGLSGKVIDIMKVDIEGYTYQLLNSFHKNIDNVKMLHLETEKDCMHEQHQNNIQVAQFMRHNGFRLVGIQYEWGEHIEDQIWANTRFI